VQDASAAAVRAFLRHSHVGANGVDSRAFARTRSAGRQAALRLPTARQARSRSIARP